MGEINLRDLYYLKNLLDYEKTQMEKANVSQEFFEYQSVCKWLRELEIKLNNWRNEDVK